MKSVENFRELGGIITAHGKAVKRGLLFRSGELSCLSDGDALTMRAMGMRAVIDFRDTSEIEEKPDRMPAGAVYYHLPVLQAFDSDEEWEQKEKRILSDPVGVFIEIYVEMARGERAANAYREFFNILASLEEGAALWHCKQGKDRTGIATFLLLVALGVTVEDAIAEYLLTNDAMREQYEALLMRKELSEQEKDMLGVVLLVRRECIEAYIEEITNRHGSLAGYIENELEMSAGRLKALRERYLEDL